MKRLAIDTNVLLYARGGEHPYREPCQALLAGAQRGDVTFEASAELAQELGHVLLRRGASPQDAMEAVDKARALCRLHAFDLGVLEGAVRLIRAHPGSGMRDAVHGATALRAGFTEIVSTDRGFDRMTGLRRADPLRDLDRLLAPG